MKRSNKDILTEFNIEDIVEDNLNIKDSDDFYDVVATLDSNPDVIMLDNTSNENHIDITYQSSTTDIVLKLVADLIADKYHIEVIVNDSQN